MGVDTILKVMVIFHFLKIGPNRFGFENKMSFKVLFYKELW